MFCRKLSRCSHCQTVFTHRNQVAASGCTRRFKRFFCINIVRKIFVFRTAAQSFCSIDIYVIVRKIRNVIRSLFASERVDIDLAFGRRNDSTKTIQSVIETRTIFVAFATNGCKSLENRVFCKQTWCVNRRFDRFEFYQTNVWQRHFKRQRLLSSVCKL